MMQLAEGLREVMRGRETDFLLWLLEQPPAGNESPCAASITAALARQDAAYFVRMAALWLLSLPEDGSAA